LDELREAGLAEFVVGVATFELVVVVVVVMVVDA
jgi:hypothetical protein